MSIDKSEKISMLERFSEYLEDPNWKYCESGDRYKIVLEEFPIVSCNILVVLKFSLDMRHYNQTRNHVFIKLSLLLHYMLPDLTRVQATQRFL